MPGRRAVPVVLATRTARRGHVGLHQLGHHLQPGPDREGEWSLPQSAAISFIDTHLLGHGERTRTALGRLVLLGHSGPLSSVVLADAQHLPQGRHRAGDRHLKFYEDPGQPPRRRPTDLETPLLSPQSDSTLRRQRRLKTDPVSELARWKAVSFDRR